MPTLFDPIQLGAVACPNRVFMAPLTRCRAVENRVPNDLMAEYYTQRAGAGLIITEATSVSPFGHGYPNTPGIHNDAQVAGWQKITSRVQAAGGRIFLQLWNVGRISHPVFQPNGETPIAPSAIRPKGKIFTGTKMEDYPTPRALETAEIPSLIEEYRAGAQRAKDAGFDGVEIHNANGYLLDQFLRDGTNQRTDRYGGSLENRARLSLEVVEAVVSVWGADRVGIRFSPGGVFNDMSDSDPLATFGYILEKLNPFGLAYAHVTEMTAQDLAHGAKPGLTVADFRPFFHGKLVTAGGFDGTLATEYLKAGTADAIAFGTLFIANPDLPLRLKIGAPLNEPDERTFYASGPVGYTDYPVWPEGVVAGIGKIKPSRAI